MVSRLQQVDLATVLDGVFLGAILLVATQFARSVIADPGGTPSLLRLSTGGVVPATAPELGLVRPEVVAPGPGAAGLGIVVPEWIGLALLALAVLALGLLWVRVGRPV